ncbi:hypothetical protein BV22DRAFT_1126045 [Leucogyrophana mollusca]|uniref:Uncharacterized protein n=1 Tax=Leucogyrophana mollusca TaxID=85980 RepID=A0ACB8BT21_9AGAM|nr:hypothetical protein BV22DRAFT_1126045 [Leucogyrophana mollusca]
MFNDFSAYAGTQSPYSPLQSSGRVVQVTEGMYAGNNGYSSAPCAVLLQQDVAGHGWPISNADLYGDHTAYRLQEALQRLDGQMSVYEDDTRALTGLRCMTAASDALAPTRGHTPLFPARVPTRTNLTQSPTSSSESLLSPLARRNQTSDSNRGRSLSLIEHRFPRTHVSDWRDIRARAVVVSGTRTFVPQALYRPNTNADRERYVHRAVLSPPIIFIAEGTLEWGIPLESAVGRRIDCLRDKDEPVFEGCGPSVSIRLGWPGYFPRHKQIPTMDYRKPKGPITKAKLAKNIASLLRRFMNEMEKQAMDEDADPAWRVGGQHIRFEDLILVSLHHVSQGSWQPQLRLRRELNGTSEIAHSIP